jgi:regulatory protein
MPEITSDAQVLALEHALGLAYAYLNRRERSQHEVRQHLLGRGVSPTAAEEAIVELGDQGYLDDLRFAALFAQDKGELEGWGSDRIRRGLLARGIPAEVAEAALSKGVRSAELDRALVLLRRRFPEGVAGRRESDRALGMLLRKGYDYELCADALAEHRRAADMR